MREIKFRGKRKDNKEWVYGYLVLDGRERHCYIVFVDWLPEDNIDDVDYIEVYKHTIGQFTGLYDKNGKEIYEGDIIDTGYDKWIVKFGNGSFYATIPNTSFFLDLSRETINYYEIKVIGNIYDNPELIKS